MSRSIARRSGRERRCSSSSFWTWCERPGRLRRCPTRSKRSSRATSTGFRPPTGRSFDTPPCSGRASTPHSSRQRVGEQTPTRCRALAAAARPVDAGSVGRLRFRNTLVRDAAYEGLPYRRRRDLHAHVGRSDRVDGRLVGRGRSFDARASLLRGPAPREGMALLPHGRRPGARDRGPCRSGEVLRAGADVGTPAAQRRRPGACRGLGRSGSSP